MQEWLRITTEYSVWLVDFMALAIVLFGSIEAFVKVIVFQSRGGNGSERRDIWLGFARWLVAGLTFQLAADIMETSITSDWQAVARIAAIAVIRTFLNYFLERDLNEVRETQHKRALERDAASSP